MNDIVVTGLRIGRRRDAAIASTPHPPVSWVVRGPSAWRAARAQLRLDGGEPRSVGPDSVLMPWPFAALRHGDRRHTLEVRVCGGDGVWSAWSEPLDFAERFVPGPWTAPLLRHRSPSADAAPLFLRREVDIPSDVTAVTLATTAQGVHQVLIDGVEIDDHVLKPGWTAYRDRLTATVTDVTALTAPGSRVALAVRAAGGWFTERFGFGPNAERWYGDQPAVSVRLRFRHASGQVSEVDHDGWRADPHPPLVASGLYAGDTYDDRLEKEGWVHPGFDDSAWPPARIAPLPDSIVVGTTDAEPVRRLREVAPISLRPAPDGHGTIVDFGQNLVGRVRLTVDAPEGAEVVIRHAEVLEDGELCTWPLRAAAATDRVVAGGRGPRVFEPEFAVHGFRYAEITGLSAPLDSESVRAVVVGSDLRRTGWFSSSHALLDRLHENVVWSLRGNLLSVPTDCPQRDERLGWTGDAQVFAPAAASVFDVDGFFGSWLDDLAIEQRALGGVVPTVVPNPLGDFASVAAAGWGDAVTTVPALLAERFGDAEVRLRLAPSMAAWVEACERLVLADDAGDGLWERGFQYGDWLDPTAARPDKARADPGLVASAYRIRSARLAVETLRDAGDLSTAERMQGIADRAVAAFRSAYLTSRGRLMSDAPTAYALILAFDLAPAGLRSALGERLAFLLRAGGYRMATGFLGTPVVLDALLDSGQEHAAEQLLFQTMCPSWLYPVTQGATTMWERWDAVRPDGTLHPSGMLSLNHCAFGAVADVLHRRIGGLAAAEPGFRRLRIEPWFPEALEHAEVVHETPYGVARVRWQREEGVVRVSAEIPTGTDADVLLPDRSAFTVGSGSHEWRVAVTAPARPVLAGVDSDLADVADTPGACALVSRLLSEHDPTVAAEFDAYIRWVPGRSLRPELTAVSAPSSVVERIDLALRGVV